MGKKRITTTGNTQEAKATEDKPTQDAKANKVSRRQVARGVISISSTYNNTIISITDTRGEVITWSSAGSIGFKGTRKSTPYAATLVAKDAIEKAQRLGLKEAQVVVRGIGPGREGAIRGIASSPIEITSIVDATPQPHNGVKPRKPRRV